MIELGPDKDEKVEIEMPLSALQYEQVTSDNLIKPTHSVILCNAVHLHMISCQAECHHVVLCNALHHQVVLSNTLQNHVYLSNAI